MDIHIKESNYEKETYVEAIQDLDILCGDLVSHGDIELANFEVASNIGQQKDVLDGDDSYYASVSADFEAIPKFKLLEDSMHKDLIQYMEANYVQILKVIQVEWCKLDVDEILAL